MPRGCTTAAASEMFGETRHPSSKGGRDGTLVVVSPRPPLPRCPTIARSLQAALDDWQACEPQLRQVYEVLNSGAVDAQPFDQAACASPLPRAYQWPDGSAYIKPRRAGGASPQTPRCRPRSYTRPADVPGRFPDSFIGPRATRWWPTRPGASTRGRGHRGDRRRADGRHPCRGGEGDPPGDAGGTTSACNLIPNELAKGFGFFQSKPASAFSPVAVTPDDRRRGDAWKDARFISRWWCTSTTSSSQPGGPAST